MFESPHVDIGGIESWLMEDPKPQRGDLCDVAGAITKSLPRPDAAEAGNTARLWRN